MKRGQLVCPVRTYKYEENFSAYQKTIIAHYIGIVTEYQYPTKSQNRHACALSNPGLHLNPGLRPAEAECGSKQNPNSPTLFRRASKVFPHACTSSTAYSLSPRQQLAPPARATLTDLPCFSPSPPAPCPKHPSRPCPACPESRRRHRRRHR